MALITGPGLFVVGVLAAALSSLVVAEIKAWRPSIIRGLIKFAVGRLPENQRERFEEEWQSHVNDVPGTVGKLLVAAGFLIAAYDVVLIDRRNNLVEAWLHTLAQFDDMRFTVTNIVSLLQNNDTLVLRPEINSPLNDLRSYLSTLQKTRDKLASDIATASATPQSFLLNLSFILADSILRRNKSREGITRSAKYIRELADEIVKRMGQKTKTLNR